MAHPTYQQALAYQAPAPSSDGLLWFVAGSVGFALLGTVVLVILLIDALPWTCALWLLIPVAVAIVLAVLLRRSRKGPSAYRELVVILETRRVRAVENPLELVVQFRNGARLQCYGYRPVAERMVTPGDIGVGFFTKVALQGDVMYDFVPIDA